jgi:SAM-dependent methyltransferase
VDDRVFRRIQRYGWDLAAGIYVDGWVPRLAALSAGCVDRACVRPGETVLDLACGPGVAALLAALRVGPRGRVIGLDISERMVAQATSEGARRGLTNVTFARRDMEATGLEAGSVDVVVCAFGLMYAANRGAALAEARRVLRPGGRLVVCVWGRRDRCGFAEVFPIIDRHVTSEVCPFFFAAGVPGALDAAFRKAGLRQPREQRTDVTLFWPSAGAACDDMLMGGPVALAWSRFSSEVRQVVRTEYLASLEPFRRGAGYDVPCEVVYGLAAAGDDVA